MSSSIRYLLFNMLSFSPTFLFSNSICWVVRILQFPFSPEMMGNPSKFSDTVSCVPKFRIFKKGFKISNNMILQMQHFSKNIMLNYICKRFHELVDIPITLIYGLQASLSGLPLANKLDVDAQRRLIVQHWYYAVFSLFWEVPSSIVFVEDPALHESHQR